MRNCASVSGSPHLQEEAERLRAILGTFPTTEDEDRNILANGDVTDWRSRTLIDFRIRRKESLRLAIERLEAALTADQAAESSTESSTESTMAQDSAEESAQSSASRITESVQASGVKKRAAVNPVEDASEDLQEPKFIKMGSAAVDEL